MIREVPIHALRTVVGTAADVEMFGRSLPCAVVVDGGIAVVMPEPDVPATWALTVFDLGSAAAAADRTLQAKGIAVGSRTFRFDLPIVTDPNVLTQFASGLRMMGSPARGGWALADHAASAAMVLGGPENSLTISWWDEHPGLAFAYPVVVIEDRPSEIERAFAHRWHLGLHAYREYQRRGVRVRTDWWSPGSPVSRCPVFPVDNGSLAGKVSLGRTHLPLPSTAGSDRYRVRCCRPRRRRPVSAADGPTPPDELAGLPVAFELIEGEIGPAESRDSRVAGFDLVALAGRRAAEKRTIDLRLAREPTGLRGAPRCNLLGHADPRTTAIYTAAQASDLTDALREAGLL